MSDVFAAYFITGQCRIAAKAGIKRIGIQKDIFDKWFYNMRMQHRFRNADTPAENLIHTRTGIIVLRGLASERKKKDAQQHNTLQ